MEAADQHIRPEVGCNIDYAFMGTSADEILFLPFPDLQILLMAKRIRSEYLAVFAVKAPAIALPAKGIAVYKHHAMG